MKLCGHQYLEGFVVDEGFNVGHAIGPSLYDVASVELLLHVEEHLAATVDLGTVPRDVEPTGIVEAVVHVESVEAYVFCEVEQLILRVLLGVIRWDDIRVMSSGASICGQNNAHRAVARVSLVISESSVQTNKRITR